MNSTQVPPEIAPIYETDSLHPIERLSREDLGAVRGQLLQIRAQAMQMLPIYDEARPRPPMELGWGLMRIAERIHAAVAAIAALLGIAYVGSTGTARRSLPVLTAEALSAALNFLVAVSDGKREPAAEPLDLVALRAASVLFQWAETYHAAFDADRQSAVPREEPVHAG